LAKDFVYVAYDDSSHTAALGESSNGAYETVGSKDSLEFSDISDHDVLFEANKFSKVDSPQMEDADFVEIELASSIQASSPKANRATRNPINAHFRQSEG
jgi:hypothetical protein